MARRELIERSDPTSVFASLYSQPSQVADQYAFIPREAVSRFLLHCTECQRKPAGMVNNFDIKSELSSEPSEFETKPTTPQLATPPATPPSGVSMPLFLVNISSTRNPSLRGNLWLQQPALYAASPWTHRPPCCLGICPGEEK